MPPKSDIHEDKRHPAPATRRHVKTKASQSTEPTQDLTDDVFGNLELTSELPMDVLAALLPDKAGPTPPSRYRLTDLEAGLAELGFGNPNSPTTPLEKVLDQIDYLQNFEEGDFGIASYNAFLEKEVKPLIEKDKDGKFERVIQLCKDDPEAYRKKCREEWLARKEANRLAAEEAASKPPYQPVPVNDIVGVEIAQVRPPGCAALDPGIFIDWKAVIEITAGLPKEVKWIRERTCRVIYKLQELEKGVRYCSTEYRKTADSVVASIDAYNCMVDTPATNKKAREKAKNVYLKLRAELVEDIKRLRRGCANLDVYREKLVDRKFEFANQELVDLVLCHAKIIDANELERRAIEYEKQTIRAAIAAKAAEAQNASQTQADNEAQPSKEMGTEKV